MTSRVKYKLKFLAPFQKWLWRVRVRVWQGSGFQGSQTGCIIPCWAWCHCKIFCLELEKAHLYLIFKSFKNCITLTSISLYQESQQQQKQYLIASFSSPEEALCTRLGDCCLSFKPSTFRRWQSVLSVYLCDGSLQIIWKYHQDHWQGFTWPAPSKLTRIQRRVLPLLTEPPSRAKSVCPSMLKLEWLTSRVLPNTNIMYVLFAIFEGVVWTRFVVYTFVMQGVLQLNFVSW